jgi:hypothetical protein
MMIYSKENDGVLLNHNIFITSGNIVINLIRSPNKYCLLIFPHCPKSVSPCLNIPSGPYASLVSPNIETFS